MINEQEKITEILNNFFGADAMYFDVDSYALAKHLIENKCRYTGNAEEIELDKETVTRIIKTVDGDFTFEYGIVTFKHRFSIKRSLDDYEEITLNKCIRIGLEYKYYTMACDKLIAELQIVYKDENDKLQCLKKDLHEWTFEIKHKGNMKITL